MALLKGSDIQQQQQQFSPQQQMTSTVDIIKRRAKKFTIRLALLYIAAFIVLQGMWVVFADGKITLNTITSFIGSFVAVWFMFMVVIAVGSFWIKD